MGLMEQIQTGITLAGELGHITKSDLATLRAMLTGLGSYNRRTVGEEAELFGRHKKAVRFAHEILAAARFRGVATASVRGVLARASYSADHDKLRHFADVLQSGVASCEEDQPITLLLQFLIKSAQGPRGRPEMRERYVKTERALSAYLAGDQVIEFASRAGFEIGIGDWRPRYGRFRVDVDPG